MQRKNNVEEEGKGDGWWQWTRAKSESEVSVIVRHCGQVIEYCLKSTWIYHQQQCRLVLSLFSHQQIGRRGRRLFAVRYTFCSQPSALLSLCFFFSMLLLMSSSSAPNLFGTLLLELWELFLFLFVYHHFCPLSSLSLLFVFPFTLFAGIHFCVLNSLARLPPVNTVALIRQVVDLWSQLLMIRRRLKEYNGKRQRAYPTAMVSFWCRAEKWRKGDWEFISLNARRQVPDSSSLLLFVTITTVELVSCFLCSAFD